MVSDADRYELGLAIREALEKAEDPTKDATPVPNRSGRFTLELMGYRVPFEVPIDADGEVLEEARTIKLLPVEIADSD